MNIGDRVGDYEIVQALGAGGMGEVFQVRNTLSGRIEAMKVLHSNLAGDQELADRFKREIRVQAALDHPHIARLHTAQLNNNQLVMVMEFVDGESLAQMLRNGPIPLRDAIQYACQVLDALAYAHANGVVHRDIKPANIMVTRQGTVKLMDFGIARMKADQRLTDTGKTVGSLHYMSPEQIRGTEPEPRSDIYSFGITLYEMVTGKRPFEGDSNYSIMSAHMQQQPVPPINISANVPQALSEIILMAIAKDPAARFQTAAAFHGALESLQASTGTPTVRAAAAAPMQAPPMPGPASLSKLPNFQAPPPVASSSNKRGLYMVFGSVVTVAVLALAAVYVPKYFRVGASVGGAKITTSPASTPPVTAPTSTAPAQPESTAAAPSPAPSPVADLPSPAPVQADVKPTTQPVAQPIVKPRPPQEPVRTNAQAARPPAADPQQFTPRPPDPQVDPRQSVVRQPPPPSAPPRELSELRENYNELAIRASASNSSLDAMAAQIQRQGLGLRRDIVEAKTRLDYQMKEAMDSIRAGDIAGAREHLQFASGNLAVIDKFLGR